MLGEYSIRGFWEAFYFQHNSKNSRWNFYWLVKSKFFLIRKHPIFMLELFSCYFTFWKWKFWFLVYINQHCLLFLWNFLLKFSKIYVILSLTGGYHLEVDSGSIRWFHRDAESRIIFSMMTSQVVIPRVWMHFTAVYDGYKGIARVRIFSYFNCCLV